MFFPDLVRTKCPDCYIDSQISSLQTSAISTDTDERGAEAAREPDADDSFTVSTSSQSQSASRGGIAATSQHADCLMSGIVVSMGACGYISFLGQELVRFPGIF